MKTTSFSPARMMVYALIISSLVLSLSPTMVPAALAQSAASNPPPVAGTPPPPPPHITTDAETGLVRFLGGTAQAPLALTSAADAAVKTPLQIAEGFLQARGSAFGLPEGTGAGLGLLRETSAADGRTFERFQQTYQGVPILGGELIVQMDAHKNVLSTSGKVSTGLNLVVAPNVDAAAAQAAALAAAKDEYPEAAAQLASSTALLAIYDTLIYDRQSAIAQKLVWQVEVSTAVDPSSSRTILPVRLEVLVDARTGEIVRQFSTLDSALYRKIYSCNSSTSCLEYHIEGKPFVSYSVDGDNAYLYIGDTYNFFKDTFNRDSIDGKGMPLVGKFDYSPDGLQYHNALWDGKQLLFGQGYVVADLTAHEFTHGVIEHDSKLVYLDQSGAINESLSDTFGRLVALNFNRDGHADNLSSRWLVGEDVGDVFPYKPLRDMSNPANSLYSFHAPDKITSANYYCGFDDNGGVHTNSGVGDKAAYLITDGTTNEPGGVFSGQTITGLGIDKTARLYYDVQANLLTSKAEYPDLAAALEISCQSQVGSNGFATGDCDNVHKAILATQMNQTPCLGIRGYVNPLATFVTSPIGDISSKPQPLNPPFIWRQRTDASKYQLLVKDSKAKVVYQGWFNNDLTTCPDANCTFTLPTTLKYGEHYSWAVQTHNPIGDGPWSPSKTFYTTIPGTPGQVTKTNPLDTAIIDTVRPVFTWTPVAGATGYLLKIEQGITPPTKPYVSMTLNPDLFCPSGGPCTTLPSKALLANSAYRWSVSAQFGTKIGLDTAWFGLTVNPLPGKVGINSPANLATVTSLTPALDWNADSQATGYLVTINGTAGKIIHTYDLSGCAGATCVVNLPRLEGGKQVVTVQAFSNVGSGAVSDARTFSVSAPLAPMTLSAPTNGLPAGTNRPIFTWDANSLATTYTLQVSGPVPFKKTYKPADVCAALVCTTPAEVTFKPAGAINTYQWSVTAVNKAGSFPSALWSFSVPPVGTTPFTPVLSQPANNSPVDSTQLVTLQWTGDPAAADEYILKLSGPNHFYTQRFIPSLACTNADCSWQFPDLLALGRYTWTLTGSNHGVPGKTSAVFSFTSALPAPTITAPLDGSTLSAYQLNAVWPPLSGASAYNVQLISRLNKVLFSQTLLASQVCTLTTCTAALPAGLLPDTGYHVAVKGLAPTGFGLPGASTFDFSLTSLSTFDGEFNGSQDGWIDVGPTGHWYLASNHKYWSNTGVKTSLLKAWEFTSNGTIDYTDLDAVVALQRAGCATCSTSLLLRGNFVPNQATIHTGYRFDIRGDGRFSVTRVSNGIEIVLQAWTPSPAIHAGAGWNTLRAVAVGPNLWFLINGKLVWFGTDSFITHGEVAVGMYSSGPSDELNIDWARGYAAQALTTSAAQLGQVDPQQQALNRAANIQAAGSGR